MSYQVKKTNKDSQNTKQQKMGMIKPDIMLVTKNVMVPVVKSTPIQKSYRVNHVPKLKPKVIKPDTNKNKQSLSFIEPPPNIPVSKSVCQWQKTHDIKSYAQKGFPTAAKFNPIKTFYTLTRILQTKREHKLPFPNLSMPIDIPSSKGNSIDSERSSNVATTIITEQSLSEKHSQQIIEKQLDSTHATRHDLEIFHDIPVLNNNAKPVKNTKEQCCTVTIPEKQDVALNTNLLTANISDVVTTEKSTSTTLLETESLQKVEKATFCIDNAEKNSSLKHSEKFSLPMNTLETPILLNSKHDFIHTKSLVDSESSLNLCTLSETQMSDACKDEYKNKKVISKSDMPKYSWRDINNWIPPHEKNETCVTLSKRKNCTQRNLECNIKYSWQVIGISTQTSQILLEDIMKERYGNHYGDSIDSKFQCNVKYSWQIIGTSTQVALKSCDDDDYWIGTTFTPTKQYDEDESISKKGNKAKGDCSTIRAQQLYGKNCSILYCQGTQTFAHKENQTDFTDCRAIYSWENLTKRFL